MLTQPPIYFIFNTHGFCITDKTICINLLYTFILSTSGIAIYETYQNDECVNDYNDTLFNYPIWLSIRCFVYFFLPFIAIVVCETNEKVLYYYSYNFIVDSIILIIYIIGAVVYFATIYID